MRLTVFLISLICGSAGAAAQDISATLLTGRTFSCSATDQTGSRSWPCQITFSGSAAQLSGQISWTTLSSVHRFTGSLTGSSLKITEVAAVKAGSAHLNTSYDLVLSDGRFRGRYQDRDGCSGTMAIEIGAATPSPKPAPETPTAKPPLLRSLTGPWTHGADSPENRVVIVQSDTRVTMTQTYKTSGKWVTLVCEGFLRGQNVSMNCQWAPGGNPFGYAGGTLELELSPDGNHLDGRIRSGLGGSQESHYSRLP